MLKLENVEKSKFLNVMQVKQKWVKALVRKSALSFSWIGEQFTTHAIQISAERENGCLSKEKWAGYAF